MKLIHKFKSPNFNERNTNKIDLIIIHYTALSSTNESIKYLCSKKNLVSCHYLISRNGEVYNLVSEKKRAWHAGKSYWQEVYDINSSSIGIELDFNPTIKNSKYTNKIMNSLTNLIKKLKKKYSITNNNILGHSDVAPYRKKDPGFCFPWPFLENQKLAFKIKKNINEKKKIRKIKEWFTKYKFNSQRKKILYMLNYIGYDISLASLNNSDYNKLIEAYYVRNKNFNSLENNKSHIYKVIQTHFINILLTKIKK